MEERKGYISFEPAGIPIDTDPRVNLTLSPRAATGKDGP